MDLATANKITDAMSQIIENAGMSEEGFRRLPGTDGFRRYVVDAALREGIRD